MSAVRLLNCAQVIYDDTMRYWQNTGPSADPQRLPRHRSVYSGITVKDFLILGDIIACGIEEVLNKVETEFGVVVN